MANLLESFARLLLPQREDYQLSSTFPDLQTQAERIWARTAGPRSWRRKTVTEALGVPSILSAVSLISATVGRLSLDAWQNGVQVIDRTRVPGLIVRPLPGATPRDFFLRTAFYQATRGEFWWFVAHRDGDGNADALFPIPPWEVTVTPNPDDRMRPTITWNGKVQRNEDMRHQIYMPDPADPTGFRGVGPLQLAGAAVSVAVEADAWAGNFFSGSMPSLVGTTDLDLDEIDLGKLDEQWREKDNNLPRWMGSGMKLEPPPYDAQKAQLTESRQFQVGEVARLFDMPGPLLEYQMSGQSLTYRNESDIWTDFQQRCLTPHYLEPIEQEISDLLVRSYTAKFNVWELTKADILTRYQVYESGVTKSGILSVEAAQRMEGLAPGDVNFAAVPPSPPSTITPIPRVMGESGPARCVKCSKHLADSAPPGWSTTCPRCKTANSVPFDAVVRPETMPAAPSQIFVLNQMPEQPVTIADGAIRVDAQLASPDMSVMERIAQQQVESLQLMREVAGREQVAPVVNVAPAEVHTQSFTEAIVNLRDLITAPRTRTILRDKDNNIIGSREEIA